jgi:DNA repair exonuclease SbcCD ATPase subunit
MAKGITQAQVDTAADALVVAGERPTVDRIRAFLGTGSPNTVTRMLETWWQSLGARLTAQQARVTLPGVPESVAVLATQLWDAALEAAQAEASQSCSAQMDAIAARAAQLEVDRQALDDRAQALELAAQVADQARLLAEARQAEAQQLGQHQAAQIEDLTQERNSVRARIEALERDRAELAERLARQIDDASAEREALAQHGRAVEDRAHQEVDRARQDAKALQAQLAKREQEWRQNERQLGEAREQAIREAASHQQDATAQRARAEALEQQLRRLEQTALRIASTASPSTSRRKRVTKPKDSPKGEAR